MTDKNINKIKSFGFEIIDYCDELDPNNTLFVTGCCARKLDVPRAKVRDLYLSPRCQTFVKNIKDYKHTGIISEKYGLVFLDQEVDNYNFGPADLKANPHLVPKLQEQLRTQIKNEGVDNLVIFGPPLMTVGFMNLLSKVECNKFLCYGTNRLTKESINVIESKTNKTKKKVEEPQVSFTKFELF